MLVRWATMASSIAKALSLYVCIFDSKGGREFSGWALRPHGNDGIMYNLALSRSIAFMKPS
jgi:ribosomal protein L35AE/L33A